MNEQSEIQIAIQSALETVKSDPNHHLDPRKRIELYTLFGEYDEDKHLGRIAPMRGYLALKTARRVVHLWDDLSYQLYYHYLQYGHGVEVNEHPISDPQRMHGIILMMCEDILVGKADTQQVDKIVDFLYHRISNISLLVADLIQEQGLNPQGTKALSYWCAKSALGACKNTIYDAMGYSYKHFKFTPKNYPFAFEIEDTAYLAMRAECGDDVEKRLVFWTWWLTEAIPQVWEQVYGADY